MGFKPLFQFRIIDGIFCCKVIAASLAEAQTTVANTFPVIRFIDEFDDL